MNRKVILSKVKQPKVIIVALSVLLAVSLIFLVILLSNISSSPATDTTEGQSPEDPITSAYRDSIDASMDDINNKLQQDIDAKERAYLLLDQATSYYDAQAFLGEDHIEDIRTNVYKAEEIYPNYRSAYAISQYEENYGDKDTAQYYYQLFEERLKTEDIDPEEFYGRG